MRDETVRRVLNAMAGFPGPWFLLPGNHDPALAESVWTRIERLGRPPNVILLTEPTPWFSPDRRFAILPAPLRRRHESRDLTEAFDLMQTPEGAARIGLAHGAIIGFSAGAGGETEATNPVEPERPQRAGLAYLALGDWHGALRVGPRCCYSGTPEPDRFKDNDQGNVLVVRLDGAAAPAYEKIKLGGYRWLQRAARVDGREDVVALDGVLSALDQDPARVLLQLTLTGAPDLATAAALDRCLAGWAAKLRHLERRDDELAAAASDDDLDAIDKEGFVRGAIDALRAKRDNAEDPDRDAARAALQKLHELHRRGAAR
ncbi:MAG: DNA repair exonuclease [Alphaproteobacteria bacterium]|nr:DNA repair exonuclease [Alphaproteobacteria bacterium]